MNTVPRRYEDLTGTDKAAALLMASQPKHSRITEIRMRPMVEPLFGRDPK